MQTLQNGSGSVTVSGDLSDSATFNVTVNPVNDAPTLQQIHLGLRWQWTGSDSDGVLELSGADVTVSGDCNI